MFITDIEKVTYLTAYNHAMLLQDDDNGDASLNLAGFFYFVICKNFVLFINKGLFGFKKLAQTEFLDFIQMLVVEDQIE